MRMNSAVCRMAPVDGCTYEDEEGICVFAILTLRDSVKRECAACECVPSECVGVAHVAFVARRLHVIHIMHACPLTDTVR